MVRDSISVPVEENQSSSCGRISSALPFSFILKPHDSIIAVRKFRHSATFNQSSLISAPVSPSLAAFCSLQTTSKVYIATFFASYVGYILRVFSLSEQDCNQRYAYWFPLPWSQRDDSSSLAFTASCNFFLSCVEPMCRKEYPMTRPQKESDMKQEHRVTIRLTDTEFSIIENTAEQADMNISEYMRK